MLESIHNIPEASLLALSTYLSIKGTTPPYVASEEDRSKAKKDSIARFTAVTSGFHFALLVSSALQARQLLQTQLGPTSNFNPNFRNKFVIANVIQILGGLLRIKCYKVLKQFFTFKLAVRKDHKIIDSGPYSVVRHPSYTAMLLLVVGLYSTHLIYNPYLIETRPNGVLQRNAKYIVTVMWLFTSVLLHFRMRDEEEMLSNNPELATQYKAYMKRVRHRLIPFVY